MRRTAGPPWRRVHDGAGAREAVDEPRPAESLAAHHFIRVARLGELLQPLEFSQLLAETAVGLTYTVRGKECEVLTLRCAVQ